MGPHPYPVGILGFGGGGTNRDHRSGAKYFWLWRGGIGYSHGDPWPGHRPWRLIGRLSHGTHRPRALTTIGVTTAGLAFGIACYYASGATAINSPAGLSFWQRAAAVMTQDLVVFSIMLFITGIGAGWWAVSCNTLLQHRADPSKRSLVYSGINVVTNLGIIFGFIILLLAAQLNIREIHSAMWFGLLTALGGLVACWCYRGDMLRWVLACLCRLVYRIEIKDEFNLPAQGGCVVVANHQSFADGVIVTTCLGRLCRPIMHASYAFKPVRSLFSLIGCITIQPGSGRPMLKAIEAAVEAAKNGQVVVIFAEGKLSRGCDLDTFQNGASRIAARADVPIIPLRLDGLKGSFLSRTTWRSPFTMRRTVTLRLGAAMNASDASGASVLSRDSPRSPTSRLSHGA